MYFRARRPQLDFLLVELTCTEEKINGGGKGHIWRRGMTKPTNIHHKVHAGHN